MKFENTHLISLCNVSLPDEATSMEKQTTRLNDFTFSNKQEVKEANRKFNTNKFQFRE